MGQKWPFFNLFFRHFRAGKVFYDILEREKPALHHKNKKFQSRKTDIFSKELTHGFGPKRAIFPTFYFRQYMPRECLVRYSRTKNRLSRL